MFILNICFQKNQINPDSWLDMSLFHVNIFEWTISIIEVWTTVEKRGVFDNHKNYQVDEVMIIIKIKPR